MKKKIFMLLALVMAAMTASADDAPTFNLTVGANAHGSFEFLVNDNEATPEQGVIKVAEGDVVKLTIKPDEGYVINKVTGEWSAVMAAARALVPAEDPTVDALKDFDLEDITNDDKATIRTYQFTMLRADVEVSATYKKIAVVTTHPTAINPDYKKEMQDLITNDGQAEGGTLMYKIGEDGEYSEEIPQAKRMGDYTIYYYAKATDTDNYVDSEVYELKSSIGGPARDLWDLIIEAQTYLAYMQTLTPQTSKLRAAEKTLTTAINAAIVVCELDNPTKSRVSAAYKTLTTALNAAKKQGGKMPDNFQPVPAYDFFDTVGIDAPETDVEPAETAVSTVWFDLNGRRLECQPARKGIYIHNGRKVVVR